jgi:hypothetical protein
MSYDRDWLDSLKEFTDPLEGTASLIMTSIPGMGLGNSGDDDLFLYWFLNRGVNIGRSVALLVEHGFYHEAAVAARTAVEAQFYLAEYKRNKSLSHKWRYFYIYEGYHEMYKVTYRIEFIKKHKIQKEQNIDDDATARAYAKVAAKAAADRHLDDYRNTLGKEAVNEAQALFEPFERPRQSWYGVKFKELFESLRDDPSNISEELPPELEELLGDAFGDPMGDLWLAYHRFSLVAHWNPFGVVEWEGSSVYVNATLTATLGYLHAISTYINDQYKLDYDDALRDLEERYKEKAARGLI